MSGPRYRVGDSEVEVHMELMELREKICVISGKIFANTISWSPLYKAIYAVIPSPMKLSHSSFRAQDEWFSFPLTHLFDCPVRFTVRGEIIDTRIMKLMIPSAVGTCSQKCRQERWMKIVIKNFLIFFNAIFLPASSGQWSKWSFLRLRIIRHERAQIILSVKRLRQMSSFPMMSTLPKPRIL